MWKAPQSTDWQVGNGEIPLLLNALGCRGEVDKLGWMNMSFAEKLLLRRTNQASIKCFALFRQLGAATVHLPTWVTQLD